MKKRMMNARARVRTRLRAEASARVVRSQLEALLEHAPAYILAVDENGAIQFINQVLPHLKKEDIVGSFWLDHIQPEQHDAMKERFRAVLETGTSQTYETVALGPNGVRVVFSAQMGAMRIEGRVVGAVIIAQDVTDLRRMQAELAISQRLAAVVVLAAGIAHEVNTPVQFVTDSIEFLREAIGDVFGVVEKLRILEALRGGGAGAPELEGAIAAAAEAREEADLPYLFAAIPKAFDRCFKGLDRVVAIVRSLNEFARPTRQAMVAVDLNRTIESAMATARGEYEKLAELETELGELPLVTCYPDDIQKVLLDLVANAAHAIKGAANGSDRKGTIRVRTRLDGEGVVIAVTDTGTGIPETIAQRVFDPFFTTKEVGSGIGQGLALAWAVVKDVHGGELRFETTVGVGTTFFVRLPIVGKGPR
jgi:two-component system NtrC family sensor kinase